MRRFAAAFLILTAPSLAWGATAVEPTDLVKRPDLVGQEIETDGRVRLFQSHLGRGYDELDLLGTPVVFRLPKRLRPDPPPRTIVIRVKGVLTREDNHWYCDVSSLEPLANDLDRLNQAVAGLTPRDAETRMSWARWAERRGRDYKDQELRTRAQELEGEAIRIEAQRPSASTGAATLALAERARSRGIPEPEPSALAHRGFRKLAAEAKSGEAFAAIRAQIEAFFPKAAEPSRAPADTARWDAPYANDPAEAYRMAPPEARQALDHRLWADVAERALLLEAESDPDKALGLSETAERQLPDRPSVATTLLERGLKTATANPLKLRQSEAENLARIYREKLHTPERAQAMLRDWLGARRQQSLRPTDAEGRINLASQYDALLNDRDTAIALLREAHKIDPGSKEVAEAFRLRGCKQTADGQWIDPQARANSAAAAPAEPEPPRGAQDNQRLRGASEDEVRAALGGRPNKVNRIATQGMAVEQWIYYNTTRVLYVNFARTPGESRPRVIAFYSRSRTALDPPTTP